MATDNILPMQPTSALPAAEELLLQQLQQSRFWFDRHANPSADDARPDGRPLDSVPDRWELTRGIILHEWQQACIETWFKAGRRGVLKVVTGAGKTILALATAERLQRTQRASLRVAIVVPTVVLLDQWFEELAARGNLPAWTIGRMGGGHSDGLGEATRILVCVLNSAAKKLPAEVERAGVGDNLLLIVDECHRAGATEMKQVFATKRAFSLGLSATPERTDDPTPDEQDEQPARNSNEVTPFAESVLGQELGPVVFEMNYADAIGRGVLPPFRIVHYGLPLSPEERQEYDGLSRQIKELRNDLERGTRRGLALIRWCRSRAGAQNPKAVQLLSLTTERKRLLYRMGARFSAVRTILERAFAQNPDTKVILFHESIDEVMGLFGMLREAGYAVVAEHSEFPDAMRAESLRLFRRGTARIIVSARSLIEGFNVPSADLGIIVAASASVRQRVQTLGRLLRRSRARDGREKQATLYVLYAAGTVDDLIYAKANWDEFVGADRNEYFLWQPGAGSEPELCAGPPRQPALDELEVDVEALKPGGPYPGASDQGQVYSLDTQGTIRDEQGNLVKPNDELRAILARYRRTGGRFRVTPRNHFVIRLEKTPEAWQAIYLGRLREPLGRVDDQNGNGLPRDDYSPRGPYPLALVKGKVFSVLQRDKRLIAKKVRGQVQFVVAADKLADTQKRAALRQVQQTLADVYAGGHRISKITVTGAGHVVYVFYRMTPRCGYAGTASGVRAWRRPTPAARGQNQKGAAVGPAAMERR